VQADGGRPADQGGEHARIDGAGEAKGWTQADLAREMGYDPSVISKLETGATTASPQHARAAGRALGLPGVFAAWLEDVANGTGGPYQRDIAELEERARVLSVWEPIFIPGLLQTEEYMRQVYLAAELEASDGQIEQMVAARLGRQEVRVRTDPPPPLLYAVIWEPALRVPIGGPEVQPGAA
jgi:transcriptional regulator with XRE-family HTH domain